MVKSHKKKGGNYRGGDGKNALPNGTDVPTTVPAPPPTPVSPPPGAMVSPQVGGYSHYSLNPATYPAGPYAKSQYYTISGGGRRRRRTYKHGSRKHKHGSRKHKHGSRSRRHRRKQSGGDVSVLASAAVPFGLLALQRYFKGSKSSKAGVKKMGRSFKRTFRRRY
jgi:hypothetical protein